jgi:Nif-specific regulatory protein
VIDRSVISLTGLEEKISLAVPSQKEDLQNASLNERERVIAALEQAGWVQAKAARLLNMTPRQIAYRIQTLNIKLRNI